MNIKTKIEEQIALVNKKQVKLMVKSRALNPESMKGNFKSEYAVLAAKEEKLLGWLKTLNEATNNLAGFGGQKNNYMQLTFKSSTTENQQEEDSILKEKVILFVAEVVPYINMDDLIFVYKSVLDKMTSNNIHADNIN